MNAYELAKAQQAYSAPTLEEIIKQQADRIAELEKELESAEVDIDVYRHEIAELEKGIAEHFEEGYRAGYKFCANMYESTPQIKELSDEEIIILRQDTNPKTTDNWADTLSFARALLKKASEK